MSKFLDEWSFLIVCAAIFLGMVLFSHWQRPPEHLERSPQMLEHPELEPRMDSLLYHPVDAGQR